MAFFGFFSDHRLTKPRNCQSEVGFLHSDKKNDDKNDGIHTHTHIYIMELGRDEKVSHAQQIKRRPYLNLCGPYILYIFLLPIIRIILGRLCMQTLEILQEEMD